MNSPTVIAQVAPIMLSEWWPFLLAAAGIVVTWGESRVHISGLRETAKAHEAKISALETRQSSAEVREGRLLERFEALAVRLDRMEGKLDQILDQQRHPTRNT